MMRQVNDEMFGLVDCDLIVAGGVEYDSFWRYGVSFRRRVSPPGPWLASGQAGFGSGRQPCHAYLDLKGRI